MTSGIYLIRNIWNGKIYVGSSFDIEDRWRSHITRLNNRRHSNRALQAAWNKYGGESGFEFRIIEEVPPVREILVTREQYWMDACWACVFGYNFRPKAESCLGMKRPPFTVEHRKNIARAKTGANNANFGKPRSEVTKAKISAAQKGVPRKKATDETKTKMSKSHKTRFAGGITAEHREQLCRAQAARVYGPLSEETKRKMREAHARRFSVKLHYPGLDAPLEGWLSRIRVYDC